MSVIKKRRFRAKIILLCVLFFIVLGQAAAKSTFWKVESGKHTIYLLGSIHLLKRDNYPLPQHMDDAFQKSDILVLEIDPDSLELPAVKTKMLTHAMFKDGSNLQSTLPEQTYALAGKKLETLGLSIESLNQFQPWFLGITLAMLKLQELGFDAQYGIDQYFHKKSKQAKKQILSLESVDFQLELFSGMTKDNQHQLLLQTIKDLEVIEEDLGQIISAWEKGVSKALEKSLLKSFQEYPGIQKKILVDRNYSWLDTIKSYLETDQTYFIVVGAGHLVGKEGVIQLLKKEGYKVKQL